MPLQRISNTDISLTGSFTFPVISGNTVIQATDNTNAALRITQLGTGNALVVEDSANPDSTPFVVDASGIVVSGSTTAVNYGGFIPNIQVNAAGPAQIGVSRFSTNTAQNAFTFLKSRGTTVGDFTAVSSGDLLGQIAWYGADGTTGIQSASISSAVDGTPGTNDMPGRLLFSTTADGAATPTERMRIDSSGNVGIGTNSPSTYSSTTSPALTVFGAVSGTSGLINSWDSTTGGAADVGGNISFGGNDGSTANRTFASIKGGKENVTSGNYSAYLSFSTRLNGSPLAECMRIDSTGRVGIGTNAPAYKLDIYDATNNIARIASDGNAQLVIQRASTDVTAPILTFYKYRGTQASPTIPVSGDITGRIAFYAYDGVGLEPTGEIRSLIDGTPGLDDMPGRLAFYTTPDGSGTILERMRITSTGRMLVGTITENTSGGVLQVSNGITFPATQSASADANTLDDYEEGTWTPVITNGTTGVTSYYWQTGLYRKIGNMVWIEVQISVNVVGISSGNIKITGLPFPLAQKSGLGTQSKTILYGVKYAGSPSGAISMIIESSSPSEMIPFLTSDISSQLSYTSLTSGGQWHFQGCYITTS